jgi:hypothetical protein
MFLTQEKAESEVVFLETENSIQTAKQVSRPSYFKHE